MQSAFLRIRHASAASLAIGALAGIAFGVSAPTVPGHAGAITRQFWINARSPRTTVGCTLRAPGPSASLYLCGRSQLADTTARAILRRFATATLPVELRTFGRPRQLNRIAIVLTPLPGATLGYFDENDLVPVDPAHSNLGDVLYVRPPALMPDGNGVLDVEEVLAHELQHLLSFHVRVLDRKLPPQDAWLNEGLAFYAQAATGFWTPRDTLKIRAAASNPGWPVDKLSLDERFLTRYARIAYGRAGLFVSDLARHHGTAFSRGITVAPGTGLQEVDRTLRRLRPSGTLSQAFARWSVDLATAAYAPLGSASSAERLAPLPRPVGTAYLLAHDGSVWRSPALSLASWSQTFVDLRPRGDGVVRVTVQRDGNDLGASIVARSSRNLVSPRVTECETVRWRICSAQAATLTGLYNRITVVVDHAPAPAARRHRTTVRLSASFVPASDHE